MAGFNGTSAAAAAIQSVLEHNVAIRYERSEPAPEMVRDEIALRYRIPLEAARVGTRWLSAAIWISELLFLCAWFAHVGCGAFSRDSIMRLESALRSSSLRGRVTGVFTLDSEVFEEFAQVMDMYELQLLISSFGQLEEGVRLVEMYRRAGGGATENRKSRRRGRRE